MILFFLFKTPTTKNLTHSSTLWSLRTQTNNILPTKDKVSSCNKATVTSLSKDWQAWKRWLNLSINCSCSRHQQQTSNHCIFHFQANLELSTEASREDLLNRIMSASSGELLDEEEEDTKSHSISRKTTATRAPQGKYQTLPQTTTSDKNNKLKSNEERPSAIQSSASQSSNSQSSSSSGSGPQANPQKPVSVSILDLFLVTISHLLSEANSNELIWFI